MNPKSLFTDRKLTKPKAEAADSAGWILFTRSEAVAVWIRFSLPLKNNKPYLLEKSKDVLEK